MNDDDISELILRASAYLDGELSADEMARAEADPAVMAEVEALRDLQEQLADVDPPDDDVRERAIAAALDEFDLLHAAAAGAAAPTPAPSPSPNVVPFRPRPAYTRWLTAAAAVVGIGVLGAVIAGTRGGGDDEQADGGAATAAASATAEETMRIESAPMESDVAAEFGAAEATAADESPQELVTIEATPESGADTATATASEPAEGGGEPVVTTEPPAITTTVPPVEPPVSTVTPPTVPDDLGDIVVDGDNLFEVGQQLLDQYNAGELPNTPETACEFGSYVVLSWAQYDVDGTLRPALIAGHPELREVGVFDPDTCEAFDIVVP